MKSDGTGQFDAVISNATDAIILEIRNLISEMGFDPATNFTTFRSLDNTLRNCYIFRVNKPWVNGPS